jgi:(2Fe-2S) ferredoxin
MKYKVQMFVCDGGRCKEVEDFKGAEYIRELTRELNLSRGENRIKVTRTHCLGACRFKSVVEIAKDEHIWLRDCSSYSKQMWVELLLALRDDKELDVKRFKRVPIEE